MSRPAWVAGLMAALAATLAADRVFAAETAVRLEVEGAADLPFSSEVLLAAVEARLPLTRNPDPSATAVRVAPGQSAGRVVVSGSTGQQDVLVAGKEANEAARLVALAVVDVSRPLPAEPVAIARAMPPVDYTRAGDTARGGRVSAAILPGLSVGLSGREINFEPTGELALRIGASTTPFSVAASFGFARTGAAWKDRTFTLSTFPVRLGPRWRWRQVELGAGGTARLYDTSGLDGGWGALLGGFASVGTSGALARGWRWTAMAAGDAYRETVLFRADGQPLLTTGRFVLWLGLGARFGGGAS